eukprot:TRINITY_DN1080_c0_g1_i2.p1 TRINITY_DN1080_c0_g1~~TRINITY_DN1080_c0_g1_i2.p1  ORF type:complete len:362 (+),score=69.07 TRINITY_DN1080_c0_g1_i2:59-1144(+)
MKKTKGPALCDKNGTLSYNKQDIKNQNQSATADIIVKKYENDIQEKKKKLWEMREVARLKKKEEDQKIVKLKEQKNAKERVLGEELFWFEQKKKTQQELVDKKNKLFESFLDGSAVTKRSSIEATSDLFIRLEGTAMRDLMLEHQQRKLEQEMSCVDDEIYFQKEGEKDCLWSFCINMAKENKIGLSFDQAFSIVLYTNDFNINDISGNYYFLINNHLRKSCDTLSIPLASIILNLMNGWKQLPSIGTQTVYRGIPVHVNLDDYKKGEIVLWKAFTSTSLFKEVAEDFLYRNKKLGTLFTIETIEGRFIAHLSSKDEYEVLLQPNSKFFVLDEPFMEEERMIIHLQQIPTQFPPKKEWTYY